MALRRDYSGFTRGRKYPAGEDDREDWTTTAEWIYLDKYGKNHTKVVRRDNPFTEEKSYPTFRWAETEIGVAASLEWVPGWPERPVLYRLPKLLDAPTSNPILICEGEKCADAVASLGYTATCNLGGARKWRDDYNVWLDGKKRVVLLEDNDIDGRRHVEKIVRSLFGKVEELSVLSFRELEEGGDVVDWLAVYGGGLGRSHEAFRLKLEDATPVCKLPEVYVTIEREVAAVEETVELMNDSLPLYMRARDIVEPISTIEKETRRGKTYSVRRSFVRTVEQSMLSYFLRKHVARFMGFNKNHEKFEIRPPASLLNVVAKHAELTLPKIAGLINTPTLRSDGTLLTRPGWDAATELYFVRDVAFHLAPIPPNPTHADAKAALERIKTLFESCAFASDCDRSLALAAALTVVLRAAFDIAPGFFVTAPAAGTGKTYLVQILTALGCGLPAVTIALCDDPVEMEKRLSSALLEGSPFIVLDNLSGEIKSTLLAQIMTGRKVKFRLFHTQTQRECDWAGCLFGTGNNIHVVGELTRRAFMINLYSEMEHPEYREYGSDMLSEVIANRGSYVADILTIALAYHRERPNVKTSEYKPLAGYDGWCAWVRDPLIWLGECDPVVTLETLAEDDPERSDAEELLAYWRRDFEVDKDYHASDIIAKAREQEGGQFTAPVFVRPDLYGLLIRRCGAGRDISPERFGKWLKSIKGRVWSGGFRIVSRKDKALKIQKWRLTQQNAPADENVAEHEGEVTTGDNGGASAATE